MRAAPLLPTRPAATRRGLVFGDSVVGNVATPSWGPGNGLGWARRFGFLQATDVVLVISSHDAADNPSPEPFTGNPNHPLQSPVSALVEGLERYALPRLGIRLPLDVSSAPASSEPRSPPPNATAWPCAKRRPRCSIGCRGGCEGQRLRMQPCTRWAIRGVRMYYD